MGEARHRLYIVGAGSGGEELLTAEARRVISGCRAFAAGKRLRDLVPEGSELHLIDHDLEAARRFIAARLEREDVCVLTSGDPGCFGILPYLKQDFAGSITVLPGISAVQLLASRLAEAWNGWELISLHGREMPTLRPLSGKPVVYFCDSRHSPGAVARMLAGAGASGRAVVGSDLGSDEEQVWSGTLADASEKEFPGNSLLLLSLEEQGGPETEAAAPGIPDGLWLRSEGIPLSKSEVRAVLLSKAHPAGRSVIWDVGSGTGSYGIECALLEPRARVMAIEKKHDACELIAANALRFGARVETVCGEAPDCLKELPRPDLAIIGGNDGRLAEIFSAVLGYLEPGGRLVVTAFLEETRKAAHGLLAGSGLAGRQATRVSIARGKATEWEEQNPVIIFTGDKEQDDE